VNNEDVHDTGRSRERERQDRLLERTNREESWLGRLWRSRSLKKGRPSPSDERPGGKEDRRD
jgi:hypothetical protein